MTPSPTTASSSLLSRADLLRLPWGCNCWLLLPPYPVYCLFFDFSSAPSSEQVSLLLYLNGPFSGRAPSFVRHPPPIVLLAHRCGRASQRPLGSLLPIFFTAIPSGRLIAQHSRAPVAVTGLPRAGVGRTYGGACCSSRRSGLQAEEQ